MEPRTAAKKKGKGPKDTGWEEIYGRQAFVIPHALVVHPNFTRLSAFAHKLIHDLARQFVPSANGYLYAGIKIMQPYGWTRSTLVLTLRELVHYGILIRTVQGGKNKPSYYGFSWRAMTQKPGAPFDEKRPVVQPSNEWLIEVSKFVPPPKNSFDYDVDKLCLASSQMEPEFDYLVDKSNLTCLPSSQVVAISEP